jgi:hypothetical protein
MDTSFAIEPAANFFEFVRDNYIKLYPRQIQEAASVFGEWCDNCNPDLRLFRETYEEIERLAVFTKHDVCPRCGDRKAPDAHWHSTLSIGQRGGKGVLLAAMMLYAEQRTLCNRPVLRPGFLDELIIGVVAGTENTALEIINIVSVFRSNAPWFRQYMGLLVTNKVELPHAVPGGYVYPNTNLSICMFRSIAHVRGHSSVLLCLDEPAWYDFVGNEDVTPLESLLKACNNSCYTMREAVLAEPTLFGGYVVAASAPCLRGDTFDKALKKTGSRYYSCRIPTWNMNPALTREMFMQGRDRDLYAERDFGVRLAHESDVVTNFK